MALGSTDELMSDLRSRLGDDGLDRVEECLRIFAGEVEPTYLHDDQEPTRLFFPGIEARPWFKTERFDWVPIVEAAFGPIRAELDALVSEQARFSPYEDPHTKELGWAGWETFSLTATASSTRTPGIAVRRQRQRWRRHRTAPERPCLPPCDPAPTSRLIPVAPIRS